MKIRVQRPNHLVNTGAQIAAIYCQERQESMKGGAS